MKKYLHTIIKYLQRIYSFSIHSRSTCIDTFPEKITISGFFSEDFGLGRAAELTALALEKNGFHVTRHDARAVLKTKPWKLHSIPGNPEDGWIIHINPVELIFFLAHILPKKAPQGIRLGIWAWELDKLPKRWRDAAQLVDGILSPSTFVTNNLSDVKIPIWTLPHPVSLGVENSKPLNTKNKKNPFTFFYQCDGRSSLDRKNPIAAIRAFKMAFPNETDVCFILKTQHLTPAQYAILRKEIADAKNITFITGALKSVTYRKVFESIDCLISSHRSEGFGLAIAETMARGIPVLATGWSGNVDFMSDCPEFLIDYKLVPVPKEADIYGAYAGLHPKWAEIDISALVLSLKQIRNMPINTKMQQRMYRNILTNEKPWEEIKPKRKLPWVSQSTSSI